MLVVQWQEHAEALNQQIAQLQHALEAAQAAAGATAHLQTQLEEVGLLMLGWEVIVRRLGESNCAAAGGK